MFPSRDFSLDDLGSIRRTSDVEGDRAGLPGGVTVTRVMIAGVPAECIEPPAAALDVLYLHGGGYALGSPRTHRWWAAQLALAVKARIVVPDYRLAPEHPFPAALEDALAVYDACLDGLAPNGLAIAGDSAGAGLGAALMQEARRTGLQLPFAAVFFCPWMDLRLTAAHLGQQAERDPIDRLPVLRRMADWYLGTRTPSDTLASPVLADQSGFPPTLVQAGEDDTLYGDALAYCERARGAGVTVELETWPEMWHCWQAEAPALPEAVEALNRAGAFLTRYSGRAGRR